MNNAAQELLDDGLLGFLRKPYDLRELALAVESAMSAQAAAPQEKADEVPP
jgi:FixJ family two-component response regulator